MPNGTPALQVRNSNKLLHTLNLYHEKIILAAFILSITGLLSAQPDATVTERNNQPPSSVTSGDNNNANVDASDAGAQRPIF